MSTEERRKKTRVDSLNLLEVSFGENETDANQGMGRTLNVSESGILLETYFPVDLKSALSLTIAIENELVHLNGKVIRHKAGKEGMFETAVEFIDADESAVQSVRKLVELFEKQEKSNR